MYSEKCSQNSKTQSSHRVGGHWCGPIWIAFLILERICLTSLVSLLTHGFKWVWLLCITNHVSKIVVVGALALSHRVWSLISNDILITTSVWFIRIWINHGAVVICFRESVATLVASARSLQPSGHLVCGVVPLVRVTLVSYAIDTLLYVPRQILFEHVILFIPFHHWLGFAISIIVCCAIAK